MVESVEISRVNIRDTLSLDVSVWMHHPDDMDFRPAMSCKDKTLTIISQSSGETLASVGDTEELLQWVRREYGHGNPSAWTTTLTIRPPRQYPTSWNDEDTILGDFLRASDKHRKVDGRDLNLMPTTEEHSGLNSTTTTLLAQVAASERMDVLDQATLLGVELLRGGKPNLVQKS